MDLDDILKFERLYCTGDIARGGWMLDQDAILEAMDMLNIKYPVRIKFMTGIYTKGTHRNKSNDSHHITVDQNHSIEDTNFTLWHELTHCAQAERFAERTGLKLTNFHAEWKARGASGVSYQYNSYEQEANMTAAQNEHIYLVAKVQK